MEKQSSTDDFGSFLETLQRSKEGARKGRRAKNIPMNLIIFLKERGPISITDVITEMGLPFSDITSALMELQNAEFVTISGPSGKEIIELTPTGENLAGFAAT